MKTNYFVLTDSNDKVLATIQNNGSNDDFKNAIETVVREFYVLDQAETLPLNVNNHIGQNKDIQVTCFVDGQDPYTETITIVSVLMYGTAKPIYQVVNNNGNPANSEFNQEAIFLNKSEAKKYINDLLVSICGFNKEDFKIIILE